MRVVGPDWILDSVEANTRLDEGDYHPSGLKMAAETETPASGAEVCNGNLLSMELSEAAGEAVGKHSDGKAVPQPAAETAAEDGSRNETSLQVADSMASVVPPGHAPSSTDGEPIAPSSPTPAARTDQLLDGVVIYFTDYQDCVEDETLDKWKLVSGKKTPLTS